MAKPTVAVLGSHSALDVCAGAKKYGLSTLVITEKGRGSVYSTYYKTRSAGFPHASGQAGQGGKLGCVDEVLELEKFSDLLTDSVQSKLKKKNCIFIPHRSFEVYLGFDYKSIETKFKIPIFGNKYLLKIEERGTKPNQYDLLEKAGIRIPKQFSDPKKIDRLCLVKVLEKERGFERAFFLVQNEKEFRSEVAKGIKQGLFTKKQMEQCVIEEFIMGPQVNLNYFYSPLNKRLEFIGTDTRRQTNLEGLSRVPSNMQSELLKKLTLKYEEGGHIAVTILESMVEQVFEIGQRFVDASVQMSAPGIIGPFALQTVIIPGPPKKEFVVFDVSPRMPGSPGIFATPYSGYLFGKNLTMGERVAMEIKDAIIKRKLPAISS